MNHLSANFEGVAHDELPFLGTLSVNLLLNGVTGAHRDRVAASLVELQGPVSRWEPGEPLVLPSAAATGTLILHDVGLLPQDDQLRLFAWIEQTAGRIRVVCTASDSLFDRVEAGVFSEALYYRLNTLLVDVA